MHTEKAARGYWEKNENFGKVAKVSKSWLEDTDTHTHFTVDENRLKISFYFLWMFWVKLEQCWKYLNFRAKNQHYKPKNFEIQHRK